MNAKQIHEKALTLAQHYRRTQAELLDILEIIDRRKIFRAFGYSSTFDYCTKALNLSENDAYMLIRVSRKSQTVPELKQEVKKGTINLSAAKRISAVIEPDNKEQWLERAKQLPQRELEKEIVKEKPREKAPDKIAIIQKDIRELRCAISEETEELVKHVQDLESQRQKKAASLDMAIRAMAQSYLEKHDKVKKAEKQLSKPKEKQKEKPRERKLDLRPPLSADTIHRINRRDKGQCVFVYRDGTRCDKKRHLSIHHIKPIAMGGGNEITNLATLCANHHTAIHDGLTGFRLKI